ncbi:AAA family ATPase [Cohnella cellulosilytica]|uniref:AAA family ATPase n=1 Tax=Cohnella cellulosilytica TaxID=986710 RepID=A0ABW2FG89_9BACL
MTAIALKTEWTNRVYGREAELAELQATFRLASLGTTELTLVSGPPGIGKTSLIRQLLRPAIENDCLFAWGKFDLLANRDPYHAIIDGVRFLIRKLLTEPDEALLRWQRLLEPELRSGGASVGDAIPELRLLLPELPSSSRDSVIDAPFRFEQTFRTLIRTLAQPDRPVVLFMDDLQWADKAALHLLQSLLADQDIRHFWLIGTFREEGGEETAEELVRWAESCSSSGSVQRLRLAPLELEHVEALLADSLGLSGPRAFELGHKLFTKSVGNPFHFKQLLLTSVQQGIVYSTPEGPAWRPEQLEALQDIEGQLDYLTARINGLPERVRRLLVCAACIGSAFHLDTLTAIGDPEEPDCAGGLDIAVKAGLLGVSSASGDEGQRDEARTYRFTHDRIRQAAYSLSDWAERERIHLAAGLYGLALDRHGQGEDTGLFETANHLNRAERLLTDEQRGMAAACNVRAGRKAMEAGNYEAASKYLERALPAAGRAAAEGAWAIDGAPSRFELLLACAECAFLCGDDERAAALLAEADGEAGRWVERARVAKLRIAHHSRSGKFAPAIEAGLAVLREDGLAIPDRPSRWAVKLEIARTRKLLRRRVAELRSLPVSDNEAARLRIELFGALIGPAFFYRRDLLALMAARLIRDMFRTGSSPLSPAVYAAFGMVLVTMGGDPPLAFELGRLAVEQAERSGSDSLLAQVSVMFHCVVAPWMRAADRDESALWESAQMAVEAGDYIFASYAIGGMMNVGYGKLSLDRMRQVLGRSMQVMEQTKEEVVCVNMRIYAEMVEKLSASAPFDLTVTDGLQEEQAFLEGLRNHDNGKVTLFQVYTYRTQLACLLGRYEEAATAAALARPFVSFAVQFPHLPMLLFYEGIALAALSRRHGSRSMKRAARLRAIERRFAQWTRMSPEPFAHRAALLAAERRRGREPEQRTIARYDEAAALARTQGDFQSLAVICECASRYHLERNRERLAQAYWLEADEACGLWQAEAKRLMLRREYPHWFPPARSASPAADRASQEAAAREANGPETEQRDLLKIIRHSIALSHPVSSRSVLDELYQTILDTASGERLYLLAPRDGRLAVAHGWDKHGDLSGPVASAERRRQSADNETLVPWTVVNYASRTGKPVVLSHAGQEELFAGDPFWPAHPGCGVACLPIFARQQMTGMLCLERPGGVPPLSEEHGDALRILASQALFMSKLTTVLSSADRAEDTPPAPSAERDLDSLTERELEVLDYLAKGLTNKEIAIRLGVTAGTIKVHTHRIFSKLNVNRRTKAVTEAIRLKLIEQPCDFS